MTFRRISPITLTTDREICPFLCRTCQHVNAIWVLAHTTRTRWVSASFWPELRRRHHKHCPPLRAAFCTFDILLDLFALRAWIANSCGTDCQCLSYGQWSKLRSIACSRIGRCPFTSCQLCHTFCGLNSIAVWCRRCSLSRWQVTLNLDPLARHRLASPKKEAQRELEKAWASYAS